MTNEELPQDDAAEREDLPAVVPNRRERRGHAQKTNAVHQASGRPQQNTFGGRRVFRRKAG